MAAGTAETLPKVNTMAEKTFRVVMTELELIRAANAISDAARHDERAGMHATAARNYEIAAKLWGRIPEPCGKELSAALMGLARDALAKTRAA